MSPMDGTSELVIQGARAIYQAFATYHDTFKAITRRAQARFEQQAWHLGQQDAVERLELYKTCINAIVADIGTILGDQHTERVLWEAMKELYSQHIAGRDDYELAETFFNSVTRKIFATVGVDPCIEYIHPAFTETLAEPGEYVYTAYPADCSTTELVLRILESYHFKSDYVDLEDDAQAVAAVIDAKLGQHVDKEVLIVYEVVKPIFFRNKAAYIVARIKTQSQIVPLLLVLLNTSQGVVVDAVLMDEDEVSIVFSFARSYFHVDVTRPDELVRFLKSIMPRKPTADLYISIGYNKHGKTELYRDLLRHLAASTDQFELARGEKGMVMLVFTMPSFDYVFKVIRDTFVYPKTTTRVDVLNRYQLVFRHDRGGRLIDAQEFEHLKFEKRRFSNTLLVEMMQIAANSVSIQDEYVVIKHVYTERRLTPLNLYLKEEPSDRAKAAVIDYGQAIKDLVATNIFPGDILLKNFGVTRHGRVVFYDYDELCLITDCNFRAIPPARNDDEELSAEPWYFVGENDVFPEEFRTFLGLQEPLRSTFIKRHGELFGVAFWKNMQTRHQSSEIIDIFPYNDTKRLLPGKE